MSFPKSKTSGSSGIRKLLKTVSNGGLIGSPKPGRDTESPSVASLLEPPPDAPTFNKQKYKSPYVTDDYLDIGKISIHVNDSPNESKLSVS